MTESRNLLAEYVQTGSDAAFRELVARYVDLVYSTALRLVEGDTHRAEDVAQTVFVDLARMARTLSNEVMLGGWLHRHTCFVAANTKRGERRRQSRERQAVEMNALQNNSEADFSRVAPILDEAINELGEADRKAILLRFFEQNDFRSVGEALGSNEDAARMRVTRALDKLEGLLKRRGVTTSAATLSVALLANAVQAAPFGLAVTISAAATIAGTTLTTSAIATASKAIAMTTLQKTLITATIAAAVGTGIYEVHLASTMRSQVQELQQQQALLTEQIPQMQHERDVAMKRLAALSGELTLRLPAPPVQFTVPPATPVEGSHSTNLFAGFQGLKDKAPNRLGAAQVESYLKANGRNAASLLAAYHTTGDPAVLEEAMQKYRNDPQVALEAALRKDASPEERRQWLEAFKQSDPANALPNYLSALDYFKAGQTDQAVQELVTASGRQGFEDYSAHRIQDIEQAYLAAGYSVAEAKAMAPLQQAMYFTSDEAEGTFASFQSQLAPLQQMKALCQNVVELAKSYTQAGDQSSAQAALQIAVNLGQRFSNTSGEDGLSRLVGGAAEILALSAMDPNRSYDGSGQTVQDRINQLRQQRAAIRGLYQQAVPLLGTMSEQDWSSYSDRVQTFGEPAALQWVVGKHGQK